MKRVPVVNLFHYFLKASLFVTMSCSKPIYLEKKSSGLAKGESAEAEKIERFPEDVQNDPKEFSLIGTGVTEVPLATPATVDNATLAYVRILKRNIYTKEEWTSRICSGLYTADGMVITAAHCLDQLKRMMTSYNNQGFYGRVYVQLPRLPNYTNTWWPVAHGATPMRAGCYSNAITFWNDVGILKFSRTVDKLAVDRAIAQLAGLPAGTQRNPPLHYQTILSSGVVPRQVNYYGMMNNGQLGTMYVSAPGTSIMSSACSNGGPCYFVKSGTLSQRGDSGGPLWYPGAGWIGVVAGTGPRPNILRNLIVDAGCGDGGVTFDNRTNTTYFAKLSANSGFFQTVFANQAVAGWWLDVYNGVYPDLFGYRLVSTVPYNPPGTNVATPASVIDGPKSGVGIPELKDSLQ